MPCCYPRTCQPLGHELIGPTKYDYCCNSHDYCTSSGNMDCIFVLMVYVLYYHRTSTAVESSLFALRRGHAARECVVGLAQWSFVSASTRLGHRNVYEYITALSHSVRQVGHKWEVLRHADGHLLCVLSAIILYTECMSSTSNVDGCSVLLFWSMP